MVVTIFGKSSRNTALSVFNDIRACNQTHDYLPTFAAFVCNLYQRYTSSCLKKEG
jgi:hypothetical protein